MRRFVFAASSVVLSSFALVGCASEAPSGGASSGEVASPIIDGTLDKGAHPAVVAVLVNYGDGTGSECTGTIFKTDPANGVGWVLSAAHCVLADPSANEPAPKLGQVSVVSGDNYATSPQTAHHPVLDFMAEPGASPPNYDLSVLKISGVTAATPFLPLTTAELDSDLASGTAVEIVGFGQTTTAMGSNDNSQKWKMDVALGKVPGFPAVGPLVLGLPVGAMGQNVCQGDSGGPWLRTINGQQTIIAVSSEEIGNCAHGGLGSRVAQGLATFVNPFVQGGQPAVNCATCTAKADGNACASEASACQADTDCAAIEAGCGCDVIDSACLAACPGMHAAGVTKHDALVACECQANVCATDCATTECKASGAGGAGGSGGSGGSANAGAGGDSAGGAAGGGGQATAGNGGASAAGAAGEGGSSTDVGGAGGANGGATTGGSGGATTTAGGTSGSTSTTGGATNAGSAGASIANGGSSAGMTPASNDTATNGDSGSSGGCAIHTEKQGRSAIAFGLLLGLVGLRARSKKRGG